MTISDPSLGPLHLTQVPQVRSESLFIKEGRQAENLRTSPSSSSTNYTKVRNGEGGGWNRRLRSKDNEENYVLEVRKSVSK